MKKLTRNARLLLILPLLLVGGRADAATDARAALRAGVEARTDGRWGEALQRFREALEVAPTWAVAHLEAAGALLRTGGDAGQVKAHLAQAAAGDPDNPRLHYYLGLVHEEAQEPGEAADAYRRALELRPSLADAHLRLGRLRLRQGGTLSAVEHLAAAVRLDPGNLAARALLAEAYEAAGDASAAEDQLRRIVALYPDNAFHLQRLARFYDRQGLPRQAREAREKADALRPRDGRKLRPLLPSVR